MPQVVRANSAIRNVLGEPGIEFLEWAAGAIERILPHAEVGNWAEVARRPVESVWSSQARDAIRVTIPLGPADSAAPRAVQTIVQRRSVPGSQAGGRVLDPREFDITRRIARRIAQVLSGSPTDGGAASLSAIRDAFDEQVVAEHVASHHQLDMDMTIALDAIHELAEQTYENKPLTFGGVIDPGWALSASSGRTSCLLGHLRSDPADALTRGNEEVAIAPSTGGALASNDCLWRARIRESCSTRTPSTGKRSRACEGVHFEDADHGL